MPNIYLYLLWGILLQVARGSSTLPSSSPIPQVHADIVVLEATPGGILAAIAAARTLRNASATDNFHNTPRIVLISTKPHIGGMCTNGLARTDVGRFPHAIGGLALEFFTRNGARYNPTKRKNHPPEFNLEPHVAEEIFWEMLEEEKPTIQVLLNMELTSVEIDQASGAEIRFQSITLYNQTCIDSNAGCNQTIRVSATIFVDASYEGDLYGRSNVVPFAMGRESQPHYNESLAGRQPLAQGNQIHAVVSPRWDNGSLIPLLTSEHDHVPIGTGDAKMEACSFRLCFTKNQTNGVPLYNTTPPKNYHPQTYELARRYAATLSTTKHSADLDTFLGNIAPTVGDKYDCNNGGGVSLDLIGGCQEWATGDRTLRRDIFHRHVEYTQGLLYFLSTDPSLPLPLRQEMQEWYLCKDEYADHNHWPRELYVREARRLIGEVVYTQNSLAHTWKTSIGLGGYGIDSHNVQRIPVVIRGIEQVKNEGDIQTKQYGVHEIPLEAMLPKRTDGSNGLVPVALSASHVGFAAVRFEPTWMVLGHAAGSAAAMCVNQGIQPHDLGVSELQRTLVQQGQRIRKSNKYVDKFSAVSSASDS